MLLVEYATMCGAQSVRRSIMMLRDAPVWQRLVDAVKAAFPDKQEWRLSEHPISRSQYMRQRSRHFPDMDAVNNLGSMINDLADDAARLLGIGQAPDSLTHPHPSNISYGDLTHMEAMFNHYKPWVDQDGVIHERTLDPDAHPYHLERVAAGRSLVSHLARTEFPNERLILRLDIKPRGIGDGTMGADQALDVYGKHPGMRGTAWDMAMQGADIDRIFATGRHALVKTHRTKKGAYANLNLGEHTLKFHDHRPSMPIVINAIDGLPRITVVVDGELQALALERVQTEGRNNSDGTVTLYGTWRVPNQPEAPIHLRGGQILIRHNSTADECSSNRRRTRALRTIPEGDPDFDRLFPLREDVEAMHHHLKSQLVNRRCRAIGDVRNKLCFLLYQLRTIYTAVIGLATTDRR